MGGHGKGSNFERLISRMLSKWWSHGERDDIFWRSANSGGWNHARRNAGKGTSTQYGDIQAIDKVGQPLLDALCIEIKIGYGRWSVLDCIDRPNRGAEQTFDGFMKQVTEECAQSAAAYPVLIAKRDMRECVIFIPNHLFGKMKEKYGTEKLKEMDCYAMWIRVPSYKDSHMLVLRFDEFLEFCPPEFFMERLWEQESEKADEALEIRSGAGFPRSPRVERRGLLDQAGEEPVIKSSRRRA